MTAIANLLIQQLNYLNSKGWLIGLTRLYYLDEGLIKGRLVKKAFTNSDDEYKSATNALKEARQDFNESLADAHLIMDKGTAFQMIAR